LKDTKQGGLIVRLRSSGARAFYYTYTRPERKGSFKTFIGKFPTINVAAARKQAAMLAGERARGVDLTLAKREQKQAAKKAANVTTLGALIGPLKDGEEDKCPYAAARRDRERIANWQHELGYLRRNLLADHRNTNIKELPRRDVIVAMNKLDAAGKRGASAGLWKHTSTFLGWALEQGYIDVHPLANARRRRKGSRAETIEREAKGRALRDQEIVKVWNAAERFGSFGLLTRFCLLTGVRRGEAASLKWSDVLNDRVVIAAEVAKMARPHAIPKTTLLNEVLEEAARSVQYASSELVFPGRGGRPFGGFTKALARLIEQAGTEKFSMHDLRRSTRTTLGRLGYSDQLQRLAVGQQAPDLDRRYNKDDGFFIRKCAFESYHSFISALLGGEHVDNVINLYRNSNPEAQLERQLEDRLRQHRAQALAAGY
jgi:integrase